MSRCKKKASSTDKKRPAYRKRVVLLPQCLRNTKKCRAKEQGGQYICRVCGNCKIADIVREARRLKYRGVYILKGGSAVRPLLSKEIPDSVIGVACKVEGAVGKKICKSLGVRVRFVPLIKDGCADTDVDLDAVFRLMEG